MPAWLHPVTHACIACCCPLCDCSCRPWQQIISQKLPYIQQMHGSSTATATALGGVMSLDNTTATANVTGVIR